MNSLDQIKQDGPPIPACPVLSFAGLDRPVSNNWVVTDVIGAMNGSDRRTIIDGKRVTPIYGAT